MRSSVCATRLHKVGRNMSLPISPRTHAVGVMLIITLLSMALSMAACGDDAQTVREANQTPAVATTTGETPTPSAEIRATELKEGDCVNSSIPDVLTIDTVVIVPCSGDWQYRVLQSIQVAYGEDYPDKSFFTGQVSENCGRQTGTYLYPSAEGWELGDRTITCLQQTPALVISDLLEGSEIKVEDLSNEEASCLEEWVAGANLIAFIAEPEDTSVIEDFVDHLGRCLPGPSSSAPTTGTPAASPTPEPTEAAAEGVSVHAKRGYSAEHGTLSPYIKPQEVDGTGRKLLAIYMVGSDLEEDGLHGSIDLGELLDGYFTLPDPAAVEVIVAFGGADKDGWRGMKFADASQLLIDSQDLEFGNETSSDSYLYQANGAHMGDESSLKLFLDYLRDGYVNFDQRFLTFWDHGNSYKGFGNDSNFNSDPLYLDEIAGAFQQSQAGQFDLIGFDACLMASAEVAKAVEPYGRYMIASEELEPGHGWLWGAVIHIYAQTDSIVEAGKGMVDNFVQDVHQYKDTGKTLSLLDLAQYDHLITALNPVLSAYGDRLLQDEAYTNSLIFGTARAQSFGVSEREDSKASIDLRHFTQLLAESGPNTETVQDLNELTEAVDGFVVHANHDGSRPDSYGISIDAPENAVREYSAYKINDEWLELQSAFVDVLLTDAEPPEIIGEYTDSDGTFATVLDENLARVTTLYGFIEPVEFEDGSAGDYFMVVAEEPAFGPADTGADDLYLAPTWDQWWFTVEYDPEEATAWIPAFLGDKYELDGQEYKEFVAEVEFYQAQKDYSGREEPFDLANMTLVVNEDWEVVDYYINTYQLLFSGPDDEEGTIQFDKASFRIAPGDGVQFWNYGFSLKDAADDLWFPASDIVTFAQEPAFLLEFLEFEDESGEIIDYYYAIWAEDASGNATLSELTASVPVVDSPFGNMMIFQDPVGHFEVQVPQLWIEEESDPAQNEIFRASHPDDHGAVVVYVEEDVSLSLTEYADAIEAVLLEAEAEIRIKEPVETAQGLATVLLEWTIDEVSGTWLVYLSDSNEAITTGYAFPTGMFEAEKEMAYYSFDTFKAN